MFLACQAGNFLKTVLIFLFSRTILAGNLKYTRGTSNSFSRDAPPTPYFGILPFPTMPPLGAAVFKIVLRLGHFFY